MRKENVSGTSDFSQIVPPASLPSEIAILPAAPADGAEILAVQRLAYETERILYDDPTLPPLTETLKELLARFATTRFLKAVAGGRIVGSVRAFPSPDGTTCYVGRLVVRPEWRRHGLGAALLCRIEAEFPDAVRFELFTGHKSTDNLRLYERLGYRPFREEQANDRVRLIFLEKVRRKA